MLSCPQTNEARLPGPFLGGRVVQGMSNGKQISQLKRALCWIYTSTSPNPPQLPSREDKSVKLSSNILDTPQPPQHHLPWETKCNWPLRSLNNLSARYLEDKHVFVKFYLRREFSLSLFHSSTSWEQRQFLSFLQTLFKDICITKSLWKIKTGCTPEQRADLSFVPYNKKYVPFQSKEQE